MKSLMQKSSKAPHFSC